MLLIMFSITISMKVIVFKTTRQLIASSWGYLFQFFKKGNSDGREKILY